MRWIIQLSIVVALFNACSNSQEKSTNPAVLTSNKVDQNRKSVASNFSFVGKRSTVLDSLGWFNCWGAVALYSNNEDKGLSIGQTSRSRSECNTGEGKIHLSKLLYRTAGGMPVNMILDELNVKCDEDNIYSSATCKMKGMAQEETVLVHYKIAKETRRAEMTEMWRIDAKKGKFVKVASLGMFECIDEEVPPHEDDI